MKTADWSSIVTTKVLLVGENSTLQWKDEVLEHAMFLDYYFRHAPYDLGERSRYSEAKTIFETLQELTCGVCRPEQVHGTLLSNNQLQRPPKGKHILIPERDAREGVEHIKWILKKNPTIEYIFVMGLQTNYYLQRFGLYECGELTEPFLKGAEPRRVGLSSYNPFYQPVNAKPFREVCFRRYGVKGFPNVQIIPILPVKSYPLVGSELTNFGESFEALKASFAEKE
ncbi:MAG: hypothetical protein SNH01_09435 [Rikenellaceae bacterium]